LKQNFSSNIFLNESYKFSRFLFLFYLKQRICNQALEYYSIPQSENHRETWDNIILLLITKILKLETSCFKIFSAELYNQICDILIFNLKPELRNILREYLLRLGQTHKISNTNTYESIA
jgi:hypothetical protein